jgi:cytochrome b6-f complex iron-sulfur subunit
MPRKTKEPARQEEKPPRRGFLLKLWLGLGALGCAEIIWVVFSFLKPRPAATRPNKAAAMIEAGRTDEFKPNSVTAFPRGQFYLVRLGDGGFLALSRRCTHLGCTVPWVAEQNRFVCPCHASMFDISGAVSKSPAPRPLDLFDVRIENNRVYVDTGRTIKRSGFRKEQVVYPKPA